MLVYILLSIVTSIGFGQDPCSERVYTMLSDLSKRSPSFLQDSSPLCDRYLSKRWYRAGGSHQIPMTPASIFTCGTLYPYWMNGQLPASGNMALVEMCQAGFGSLCQRSHTIRVKNCGIYSVYELTPLAVCNSAYCFEATKTCVEDKPSNVSVSYHNVTWKKFNQTIQYGERKILIIKQEPTVNLICRFSPLRQKKLFYHVTWYVDNTEIVKNQTVKADQTEMAILSASDIIKVEKKAGSLIHCVVGAKLKATGFPCTSKSSPSFFAGIKVSTTNLEINRGKSATLYLQLTIPFADEILFTDKEESKPNLDISMNQFSKNDSSQICRGNSKDLEVNNCGIKIPAYAFSERHKYATDDWKKPHEFTIYNMDKGGFEYDKSLTLRLKTGGTQGNRTSPSRIFENIFLPDVQVQVKEENSIWKGRICGSTSDPNLSTFDAKYYSCFLGGSFILYRNERYNQEVQEKHFFCYPDVTCNCAVAVRSGRDIFTIDICRGQREIINFPLCDDKVMKVTKLTDRRYMVSLPTGTIVMIKITSWLNVWFLNIHITPSPADVNNTRGLCGTLDGISTNDFLGRDNNIRTKNSDTDDFAITWKLNVNDTENLFIESKNQYKGFESISKTLTQVCVCKNDTGKWETICEYGTRKECKFNIGKKFYCILEQEGSRRRKRDLSYLYSRTITEEDSDYGTLDLKRKKRQAVMTLMEARNTCLMEFKKSVAFRNCEKHVPDLGNSSLTNCISDIRFTGDVSFAAMHIEAAIEQCSTFIELNSTFQQVEKEITLQIHSLCPSNCSGNGICNKGNCTCNPRYAGSDCSFDLLGPPSITLISNFGFCDKSEEECNEITLYGRYFLEHMNTRCYTTRKRISENGSYVLFDYFEKNLEEKTLFEGYCPLEYSTTPTWVTYFTFNISNDGRNFTENYNVYTYQSLCQEFHNDSGKISFSFKDNYCFVDGRCIADGESNPKNECDVCNVIKDKYSWTYNEGHCYINGRCIEDGKVNLANPCEICDTAHSINSWSVSSEFCFINAVCYFNGEKRENNDCEICNIDQNKHGWTFIEDGYCLINGHCVRDGEHDLRKECHVCNPLLNKRDWSIDSAGYCFINKSCVPDGEHATLQECKICDPASKIYDWSFDSVSGTYCIIDGRCVRQGERDMLKSCNICNPALNNKDWSTESGCSTEKNQKSTDTTTTESTVATTESELFSTVTEATVFIKASSEPVTSIAPSKTLDLTALFEITQTKSTLTKTMTAKSTLKPKTTKTPTDIEKDTTKTEKETQKTTIRIDSPTTERTKVPYTTLEKSTTTKAVDTNQDVKEATTKKLKKDKLTIETSTTLIKVTDHIPAHTTTKLSSKNPIFSKDKLLSTDPVTSDKTKPTKTISDQVLATIVPISTKLEISTVFIEEVKTTTVPNAITSSVSKESTNLIKISKIATTKTPCCSTTDNKMSPNSNAVSQHTVLAVSIAAPAVFVLVSIVIASFFYCYRRSYASVALQAGEKANFKMDMKGPSLMRQTKTKPAEEIFSDSDFGVSSSENKYSKFSEDDKPFST